MNVFVPLHSRGGRVNILSLWHYSLLAGHTHGQTQIISYPTSNVLMDTTNTDVQKRWVTGLDMACFQHLICTLVTTTNL